MVIATYNRSRYAAQCVASVLANKYDAFEVIIVDQSSNQDTQREVEKLDQDNVRVCYAHSDVVGVSNARNRGVALARGDIVAFIDDDAIATPGWIAAYARAFRELKPQPGMVGGKIDPLYETPRPKWYPSEREFLLGIYNIGDELQPFPPGDLPISANFAVQKSVIDSVGDFDARIGFNNKYSHSLITGEDSLLALKIKEQGYPIYYQPDARVLHIVRKSKLSKKFFLKRHFWEGATIVAVRDTQHSCVPGTLGRNIRWHVARISYELFLLMRAIAMPKGQRAPEAMLRFAELSLSAGVIYWSSRLLVNRWTGQHRCS